jgi:hypothetical protein
MCPNYVPILKWKQGEKAALRNLNEEHKNQVVPLLEVIDADEPTKIIDERNTYFPNHPVYIDTHYIDGEDGAFLISLIEQSSKITYPVLYPDDFPSFADNMFQLTDRVLVRIPVPEEVDGESYEEIFQSINSWSKDKDIIIDIMLDLYLIEKRSEASIKLLELKNVIRTYILDNDNFSDIIIASTSFPENLSSMTSGEDLYIDRYEINVFEKIILFADFKKIKDRFIFSDYGVTRFTDTEIDFSKLKYGVLPKARYTLRDKYWVLKGKKDTKTRQWVRSQAQIARDIYKSPQYYGENFSFGDLDIKERALGIKGPGNNKDWVTIASNHHIAVVMEELSTLLDS